MARKVADKRNDKKRSRDEKDNNDHDNNNDIKKPRKIQALTKLNNPSDVESPSIVVEQQVPNITMKGSKKEYVVTNNSNVNQQTKLAVSAPIRVPINALTAAPDRTGRRGSMAAANVPTNPTPLPKSHISRVSSSSPTDTIVKSASSLFAKRQTLFYTSIFVGVLSLIAGAIYCNRPSSSTALSTPLLIPSTSLPPPLPQKPIAKVPQKKTVISDTKKTSNGTAPAVPGGTTGSGTGPTHSLFKSNPANATGAQRSSDATIKAPAVSAPKVTQNAFDGPSSPALATGSIAVVHQNKGQGMGLSDDKIRWVPGVRVSFGESGLFSTPIANHDSLIAKDVGGIWTGSRMVSSRHGRTRNTELTSAPMITKRNPFAALGHSLGFLDLLSGDSSVSVVNRKFHVSRPPERGDSYCMQGSSNSLSIRLYASVNVNKLFIFHRPDDFACAPKRFTLLGWAYDPVSSRKRAKPKLLGSYEFLAAKSSSLPWEMQSFEISSNRRNPKTGLLALTLQFHTNHGDENKTCVYRTHVLGDLIASVSLGR